MKRISILPFLLLALAFTACKSDAKKEEAETTEETAVEKEVEVTQEVMALKFKLEPKSDSGASGAVKFTAKDGKVFMMAELEGLSEGEHAIHIHEKADCSSPDGKSTGGHWNPTFESHGKWGDETGYHKGDIGNFTADAEGKATISFDTDEWCMGCGDEKKDILGKAIIVHQGADDFTSQPSGAAGARVSCGGIIE
ncbi:superoxide dismutase family protein [Gilvibacter sediminis]|uniref:superoxide dismutase family protein n=1 Tax=Gilvibacter sediminis TaxID=379071 RepID=UPI00235081FB|nr:superoxide dismutase family protein [Gilvibacter sediminis]MDC7999000.1 superoxide dismutase family protein [Gilvibacter sediminis]